MIITKVPGKNNIKVTLDKEDIRDITSGMTKTRCVELWAKTWTVIVKSDYNVQDEVENFIVRILRKLFRALR